MKADQIITEVFDEYGTDILNISDFGIMYGDGVFQDSPVTHVVLDGDNLLFYSANPYLGGDFQDDEYEQLLIEDEDCLDEITAALKSLI